MKIIFSKGTLLALTVLIIASCKKNSTADTVILRKDINLSSNATFGKYLSTRAGLTLYMFANDADGISSCNGDCENFWPAFNIDLVTAQLDTGLLKADFATITNAGGKKQIAYKGWPLYTYAPLYTNESGVTRNVAEAPGSTSGDGVGGTWFIAKPDYSIMLANKQLTGLDGNNYKSDYTVGTGQTIYFTNGNGRAIYTFSNDSFNVNKFTKPDLSNNNIFPIYEQDKIVVPSILNKALFANINIVGKKQITYKGWPLYHFGQDSIRGLTLAVSVPIPGKWPVAVKDIADPKK